jgi:hypothetical protein
MKIKYHKVILNHLEYIPTAMCWYYKGRKCPKSRWPSRGSVPWGPYMGLDYSHKLDIEMVNEKEVMLVRRDECKWKCRFFKELFTIIPMWTNGTNKTRQYIYYMRYTVRENLLHSKKKCWCNRFVLSLNEVLGKCVHM